MRWIYEEIKAYFIFWCYWKEAKSLKSDNYFKFFSASFKIKLYLRYKYVSIIIITLVTEKKFNWAVMIKRLDFIPLL